MNEHKLQTEAVKILKTAGVIFYAIPNSPRSQRQPIGEAQGLQPGAPDLCIVSIPPKMPHLRAAYIELKSEAAREDKKKEGKKHRERQKEFGSKLIDCGCRYSVCYGMDEILAELTRLGFIK